MKKYVNLGGTWWRIRKDAAGIGFGDKKPAVEWAEQHGLSAEDVYFEDTRPTMQEVLDRLDELESEASGTQDNRWSTGPWDEYFSLEVPGNEKWPDRYRWIAVYVVTGGSEGLYLHVDQLLEGGGRRCLILGKSLASSWEDCYASAGRIAQFLGA